MACTEDPLVDIEELVSTEERLEKTSVVPKVRRRREREGVVADSIIPGTQKVFVKTWGCSHNTSDSEYMAGLLASHGYEIVDAPAEAHLWLLNSCTVKSPAEDHFRNMLLEAKESDKAVVLAGCVPQGAPRQSYLQNLSVVGVQQIDRVVEVVEESLKGHVVRLLGQRKVDGRKAGGARLDLPKIRKNALIEIIPINTGCLNQCTYCKTKHARGELGSYPPEEIVERAKQALREGVKELWLTSEDTGAYGRDLGFTLPQLLWKLVDVIPEGCRMRLGMTNPPYILEHLEEMAAILSHPRVYKFLHVPVQSGSDAVLADMRREYTRDDFVRVVEFLRERVPGIHVATDVICGFPTESEEDFAETVQLVRRVGFSTLFINQFYPRPGTPAARMAPVDAREKKRRTKLMAELFRAYLPYQDRVGRRYRVLVTERAQEAGYLVGHNESYEQVLVGEQDGLLGGEVEVEVVETGKFFMKGRVVVATGEASLVGHGLLASWLAPSRGEPCPSTWTCRRGVVCCSLLALLVALLMSRCWALSA